MWSPPERSAEANAIYSAAEADRAVHPERYSLDPESAIARMDARGGFGANDDGDWREGLQVYLSSASAEGRLNALGLRNVAASALGRLQARRGIANALAGSPATSERIVDRPVVVIGGWRTGTTLLQRLLGSVPALRGLYPSELSVPWRFAGLGEAERDALLDAGEAAHQRLHVLNPTMWSIHPSGGRLEEECVLAMGTDLRNWGFTSTLRCPSYSAWLLEQDFTSSYRRYADILRLLQDDSGRRWALKAPAHTAELASLLAVFPDAYVVQLHRDVVETVTSGASLFAVFRSTYSDDVDPVEVGRYQLEMTATWFDRAMRARDAGVGGTFIDVAYTDLIADPIAAVEKICRACAVAWTDESGRAVGARLRELRTQHGVHKYAPADFRLDPDEILSRFEGYRNRFDLP